MILLCFHHCWGLVHGCGTQDKLDYVKKMDWHPNKLLLHQLSAIAKDMLKRSSEDLSCGSHPMRSPNCLLWLYYIMYLGLSRGVNLFFWGGSPPTQPPIWESRPTTPLPSSRFCLKNTWLSELKQVQVRLKELNFFLMKLALSKVYRHTKH